MEDKQLEAAESLALIGRMIENTRNRMERNNGRPFLIWGYTTLAFTLIVSLAVMQTGNLQWNFLWFLLPVVGYSLTRLTSSRSTEGQVYTFVDRILNHLWLVLGISAWFTSMVSVFTPVSPSILFLIVLLMGIGASITGFIIRFTPATIGGFSGIVLAPLLLIVPALWQPLLFMVAFIVMMIIPGHILNYRSRQTQAVCSKN